jgi:hypothetical protein
MSSSRHRQEAGSGPWFMYKRVDPGVKGSKAKQWWVPLGIAPLFFP